MLHIKWKYYTRIVIPPYRPIEWKLSEMKQKKVFVNQSNDNENAIFLRHEFYQELLIGGWFTKLKIENLKVKSVSCLG